MRITFHGAARTVTGSQHLIEVNNRRILLDCGLYQGRRAEAEERNRKLPFDVRELDAVILSHAHMDHTGNVPGLVKAGYRGDIICTHATRDLCVTMLLDSGFIQERDAEFLNKRRDKRKDPVIQPLYTQHDAREALKYFTSQAYYHTREILPGVNLTFYDAGHMLGSAIVVLDIQDKNAHRTRRLVFSGDVGRAGIPIIRDPDVLDAAEVLIMESTYGDRLHSPYPDAEKALEKIVNDTYRRGGSIVIPSFAVGRAQQLVYTLNRLHNAGDIPHLPVFVDSPLAVDATQAFRSHPECYDEETERLLQSDSDPFGFKGLTYTRSQEDSKRLNFMRESVIIISASGMAEHGRILHHLRNRIGDARNTVLIVGWQAEHTLGRKLVERAPIVRIFGEEHEVRAHVEVLNGFSGHADRDELLDWVGKFREKPARTYLVHGEETAATALAKSLHDSYGLKVDVPAMHQSFEV